MAPRVFADQELEALRRFPEIGREELFRSFTLTPSDVAFVDSGRGRGPVDRLGLAVALCTLPWLRLGPDDVAAAPRAGQEGMSQARPDAITSGDTFSQVATGNPRYSTPMSCCRRKRLRRTWDEVRSCPWPWLHVGPGRRVVAERDR